MVLALASGWVCPENPIWRLGGDAWRAGLSWDCQLESLHDLFRWRSLGSQISYLVAQGSLREGPQRTRWKLHGFSDSALGVT